MTDSLPTGSAEIEIGKSISRITIRERISETGLQGHSARKKHFLFAKHRKMRLAYAKQYEKRIETDWDEVLLTGDTHEVLTPNCVKPTFNSSHKSVMVWSSICGSGVGPLLICEASVNGEYYRKILDNAPANTTNKTKKLNRSPTTALEDLAQKLPKLWYQIHDDVVKIAVSFQYPSASIPSSKPRVAISSTSGRS
ncbi:Transposase [Phytophthora infestans]|uniref:Transposase n=1 Tax=Phytophthora infestans TaxID=4787 RepID=A0A833VVT5_PHYIN|nr:Transposase [Phytophthora infestans]